MLRNVFEFKLIFGMGGVKRILICWNVLVCNVGCVGKGRRFLNSLPPTWKMIHVY